jgi:Ca2+-binding RTX toxin-like protein
VFVHLGFGIARGSDGPDSITDVESIRGSGEADTLVGNIEGNVIRGLGGDDLIAGGRGPDLIDGGRGNDTVQYSNAASGVFVHLGVGIGRGGDGADTVRNIENAMGSVHSDHLVGSSGGNRLMGSDGDDFLNARAGADRIDGGSGSDSAAFNRADAGVFVHLGAGIARGGDGPDTLVSIEKALGSRFDDTIVGTDGSNTLRGRAGDDQIRGDGGRDFLFGDFGQDNFVFNDGHGNDVVGDAEQGDRFDLRGVTGFDSFSDVQNALSGTASRSVIDTGADSSITLVGIGVNDLDSGDFLL